MKRWIGEREREREREREKLVRITFKTILKAWSTSFSLLFDNIWSEIRQRRRRRRRRKKHSVSFTVIVTCEIKKESERKVSFEERKKKEVWTEWIRWERKREQKLKVFELVLKLRSLNDEFVSKKKCCTVRETVWSLIRNSMNVPRIKKNKREEKGLKNRRVSSLVI